LWKRTASNLPTEFINEGWSVCHTFILIMMAEIVRQLCLIKYESWFQQIWNILINKLWDFILLDWQTPLGRRFFMEEIFSGIWTITTILQKLSLYSVRVCPDSSDFAPHNLISEVQILYGIHWQLCLAVVTCITASYPDYCKSC
jgi:hypothetical protein